MLFFVLHFVLCYILFFTGVLSSILLLFFYSVLWFVKFYSIVFYSSVLSCILFYFPLWWGKLYSLFCFVVCWVEFYCIVFSLILLSYSIELCSYLLFCGVLSYIVLTCVLFYVLFYFFFGMSRSALFFLFCFSVMSWVLFDSVLFLSVPLLCGKKKSILFYYSVEFYCMFFFGLLWWVELYSFLFCCALFYFVELCFIL